MEHVTDFHQNENDVILLQGFGMTSASFLGTAPLTSGGTIPHFNYTTHTGTGGTYTTIHIDGDHNGVADHDIQLDGAAFTLTSGNFLFA